MRFKLNTELLIKSHPKDVGYSPRTPPRGLTPLLLWEGNAVLEITGELSDPTWNS